MLSEVGVGNSIESARSTCGLTAVFKTLRQSFKNSPVPLRQKYYKVQSEIPGHKIAFPVFSEYQTVS